ncbi:MAG: hypothetical protein M1829_003136 [Trizodia sp. TS-e1964]|nr:MAG: hypothetical protein M1829_003136 [Trizodia sp. TS-e1964]
MASSLQPAKLYQLALSGKSTPSADGAFESAGEQEQVVVADDGLVHPRVSEDEPGVFK